ncbi:unnamed protein product [Leuciscus chuanchicus]
MAEFCLIPDSVDKDTEKACQSIYPLHDVYVKNVKMLRVDLRSEIWEPVLDTQIG